MRAALMASVLRPLPSAPSAWSHAQCTCCRARPTSLHPLTIITTTPTSTNRTFMKWFRDVAAAADPQAAAAAAAEEKLKAERMAKAEKDHWQYDAERRGKEKTAQDTWHEKQARFNDIPPFTAQGAYHQAREAVNGGESAEEAKERLNMYHRAYEWKQREKERKKDQYTSWSRSSAGGSRSRVIDDDDGDTQLPVTDFEVFKRNIRATRLRQIDARAAKQTLGLPMNDTEVTLAMVKKAFGVRALATHPDTAGEAAKRAIPAHQQHQHTGVATSTTDEFIRVQKAYELLSDILTDAPPPSSAATAAT